MEWQILGYFYILLVMIAGVTAVIGNTLAIIVLLQPTLRTKTNKLLTSLVVSDLLMSYVVFSNALVYYF